MNNTHTNKLLVAAVIGALIPIGAYVLYARVNPTTRPADNPIPVQTADNTVSKTSTATSGSVTIEKTGLSSLNQAKRSIVGKWRNVESSNLLYTIKEGGAFQESRLFKDGEFMVPQGSWRLEMTAGASSTFEVGSPDGAVLFIRTSDKGVERKFFVMKLTDTELALKEFADGGFDGSTHYFTRIVSQAAN